MREVVLDTETTGLNYMGGDRIIEVGCVELINHVPTGKNLQFYCSTDKKIGEDAIKIHGLTNEFLNKHSVFKENLKNFFDFIKNDTLIIHNAEFDVGFINNELKLVDAKPITNRIVDTVPLARKKLNTRIANLDHLCRRFSIDLSSRKLHGALLDCHLLAGVYLELLGGKQTSFNLSEFKKKDTDPTNRPPANNPNVNRVKLTKEEKQSHKEFVKTIKNALWHKLDY
tara:strand:+ start:3721 stop:4401 length:681 start_codon:yes stop_codon:yes gene_type:complete